MCLLEWVQQASTDPLAAAYLLQVLAKHDISHDVAISHFLAHKASFKCPRLTRLIREVSHAMRHRKTGHSQRRHVLAGLVQFYWALQPEQREHPGTITREHILAFLQRYDGMAVKTWNEMFAYITSAFAIAVERGWLVVSPCVSIPRKPPAKHRPPAIVREPMAALELMRWVQANEKEWVLYFAFALFAGVRPDIREGEAHRLDEDMRFPHRHLHRPALDADGFWIRGKDGRVRHVAWSICGPLHAWVQAYPQDGLIPNGLSYSQAERQLKAIRERFDITHDELRHTGASAMLNVPGASFAQVALALGNSERMLTRFYAGLWNAGKTAALYAILPKSGPVLEVAQVA